MDWRRIPSLPALRAFEAAARFESFTKAAAELNVTQAAIAQHVRALEAEFACALVMREGRGIAVTQEGRALAEGLGAGFGTIAEAVERLRADEGRPLSIATTPSFAANWLMPRIGSFWAAHPQIAVSINPGIDLVDLRREQFDIAIRFGDGRWPGLEVELLTDGNYLIVAHPDLLPAKWSGRLEELDGVSWYFEDSMNERQALVEAQGVDLSRSKVTLTNTNAVAIAAATAGLGISLQPASLVQAELDRGDLVTLCAVETDGSGYFLVSVPGRQARGLTAFRKWIKAQVAQDEAVRS